MIEGASLWINSRYAPATGVVKGCIAIVSSNLVYTSCCLPQTLTLNRHVTESK